MIKIGPAGIPLSCKGRTIKDGVIYTRNLELDAIQVQFVRGIRTTEEEALEVGRVAQEADVEIHVHAPYYTNLAGDDRNVEMAFDKIVRAGALADAMGAKTLAVHPGMYSDGGSEATMGTMVSNIGQLADIFKEDGIKVQLALECAGKKALFGTLDEILEVCRQVPGVVPILDFAHIHARTNGGLLAQEDFEEVFDQVKFLKLKNHLVHFTGILYENGSERHHLPIKKGDLRFEPLVEAILDHNYPVTIISHSPILEHDAMYMKIVLDRVREKREQKAARLAAQEQLDMERARQKAARERAIEARKKERERKQQERAKAREDRKKAAARKKAPGAPKKATKKAAPKKATKKVASPKKSAKKKVTTKKAAKKKTAAKKKAAGKTKPSKKKAPAKKAAKKKAAKKKAAKKKATRAGSPKKKTSKKAAKKKAPAKKTARKRK